MNRAVRKRAAKLRGKALKSLGKLKGDDLHSVSNRLSDEQYALTLERFENPKHENAAELARDLSRSLMLGSEQIAQREAPKFITQEKLDEIDCCSACAWCCHQPMQVSVLSAISVADYLLGQDQGTDLLAKLENYVKTLEPYQNDSVRLKESFEPCPFLSESKMCRVYEARPVICRAFHSTDVGSCQAVVEQRKAERNVPMFTNYFGFLGMKLSGARKALKDLGIDDRPVVLATAVKMLMEDFEGVTRQWLDGERVFDPAAVKST